MFEFGEREREGLVEIGEDDGGDMDSVVEIGGRSKEEDEVVVGLEDDVEDDGVEVGK